MRPLLAADRYWLPRGLIACAAMVGVFVLWMGGVALPHDIYTNWANKNHLGCCNNMDCAPIAEGEERINGRIEVFVRGVGAAKGQAAWCPVLSHHYLSTGNAPNGSASHYCITDYYGGTTPCAQFVCYQPQAMI